MKIDRVYYNGVIRTMVSEGDTVEALAVHNGTIVAAGTSKEMRAIDACEYVDLQGRSVLPGFADTHMHLFHDCMGRITPNLSGRRAPLLLRSCHVGVQHFHRACGQDSLCNSHPAGVA